MQVPFYLDDYSSIRDNPLVYRWEGLGHLAKANLRFLGYLTFALNYKIHQLDVFGYHVVNILIHILASWAVWFLVRILLKTPKVRTESTKSLSAWLPFTAAAVFALHPLQTQAVTYVVQRLASLAALFYISGLAFYLLGRLKGLRTLPGAVSCAAAFLCFACGLFTKQNVATFPLAVLAMELICFDHPPKRRLMILFGGGAGVLFVWTVVCAVFQLNPLSLETLDRLTRETHKISRKDYFLTQLKVLWTYFRLLLFPVGLHLDYHTVVETSPWGPRVLAAAAGHGFLVGLAWTFRRRAPLFSLGIFLAYIAHGVESSIFPIEDLAFEHRTYLPNAGLILALSWVLWNSAGRKAPVPARMGVLACLLVLLGWLTWQRNETWRHPILFWADNVKWAPHKSRPKEELAGRLLEAGRIDEAITLLKAAARRDEQGRYHFSDVAVLNLTKALHLKGKNETALEILNNALQHRMHPVYHSQALAIKAQVLLELGRPDEAAETLRRSLRLFPGNEAALLTLAGIYEKQGRPEEAAAAYEEILAKNPSHGRALAAYRRLKASVPAAAAP